MATHGESKDLLPDTPTTRFLRAFESGFAVTAGERDRPKPGYREIPIDPDAPDAPVCSGRKYVVVDPDAPDAPVCKPRRYIVAPDPETQGRRAQQSLPAWARSLGEKLAERFP